jgi:hypothetical protein
MHKYIVPISSHNVSNAIFICVCCLCMGRRITDVSLCHCVGVGVVESVAFCGSNTQLFIWLRDEIILILCLDGWRDKDGWLFGFH